MIPVARQKSKTYSINSLNEISVASFTSGAFSYYLKHFIRGVQGCGLLTQINATANTSANFSVYWITEDWVQSEVTGVGSLPDYSSSPSMKFSLSVGATLSRPVLYTPPFGTTIFGTLFISENLSTSASCSGTAVHISKIPYRRQMPLS